MVLWNHYSQRLKCMLAMCLLMVMIITFLFSVPLIFFFFLTLRVFTLRRDESEAAELLSAHLTHSLENNMALWLRTKFYFHYRCSAELKTMSIAVWIFQPFMRWGRIIERHRTELAHHPSLFFSHIVCHTFASISPLLAGTSHSPIRLLIL